MARFELDHVHLNSSNLDQTIQFFEKLFSAKVIKRWETNGMKLVRLAVGGRYVNLYARAPTSESKHESSSIDHFAFRVDNLDEYAAQLKEKGAKFTVEPKSLGPGLKVSYIEGPDKLLIEIFETTMF